MDYMIAFLKQSEKTLPVFMKFLDAYGYFRDMNLTFQKHRYSQLIMHHQKTFRNPLTLIGGERSFNIIRLLIQKK